MNGDADKQHQHLTAGSGYPSTQLAKAITTALTHQDPGTRRRAERRQRRWREILTGMARGVLTVGSRTPVAGLPAWVTPEVVRGGFATGRAVAEGPLRDDEVETARRAGVPEDRRALFVHRLTDDGLAELYALLDSGRYEVTVPEEAALLTVAWLIRAGQEEAALNLVEELAPFAGRLRFTPRPTARPAPDATAVHRRTVGESGETLARRRPNRAVETQREALTVWQPFADELLAHWLRTADGDSRVLTRTPPADWLERGVELLRRYHVLATRHTYCTKHRRPKGNLAILRAALEEAVDGRPLDARRLGLLRHAVASMVRRRGRPGSARHTGLRHSQAQQAALPSHHALAQLVLRRLSGLPQDVGVTETTPLLTPVSEREAAETGLPAGAAIPPGLRQPVEAALWTELLCASPSRVTRSKIAS
jgi:hypothetical protein